MIEAIPGQVCIVTTMPACDICHSKPESVIDAPTIHGPWANMCDSCWHQHGKYPGQLGVGIGQRWVIQDPA